MTARTLFQKVWERHEVVPETADTPAVLYVDLHLTHEVTSPQAFSVLRERGLKVRIRLNGRHVSRVQGLENVSQNLWWR